MKPSEIRKKLHHYIDTADEKKIKAIFTMVEEEIEETYKHWNDNDFINELKEQEDKYLKGKLKTYTIEQSLSNATSAIKKIKKKG
jgi:hypothetical protein